MSHGPVPVIEIDISVVVDPSSQIADVPDTDAVGLVALIVTFPDAEDVYSALDKAPLFRITLMAILLTEAASSPSSTVYVQV